MISLLLLSLLLLVVLSVLNLSTQFAACSKHDAYLAEARANARMALSIALGELQKYAGPDQRVTANASILDQDPQTAEIESILHPNLLGVWKNCSADGYHLIGKDDALTGSQSVYGSLGFYKDLRFTDPTLSSNKWRDAQRLTWLASFASPSTHAHLKQLPVSESITLVSTVGDRADASPPSHNSTPLVAQKLPVTAAHSQGAYAWAIIDNSQKSTITHRPAIPQPQSYRNMAPSDQLSGLFRSIVEGDKTLDAFKNIDTALNGKNTPPLSYANIQLESPSAPSLRSALKQHFHHFTHDSSGLFTDPVYGGFKKDLTPLLFAKPKQSEIQFPPPTSGTATHPFSSSYPIIPGWHHLSHGPSFAALRSWSSLKYHPHRTENTFTVDFTPPSQSLRKRPAQHWRGEQNDGFTFKAKHWAAHYPKIAPVMTDVRYHYYFGLTGTHKGNRIRTHIVPRVCLWNPYNITLQTSELIVLMPNFCWSGGNFHFQLTGGSKDQFITGETERIVKKFPDEIGFADWDGKIRIAAGAANKFDPASPSGLFPNTRYLAFVLEPTEIPAGACLVFSPRAKVGLHAAGVTLQQYNTTDISQNVLSARSPQAQDHFYHDAQSPAFYQFYSTDTSGKKKKHQRNFSHEVLDEIRLEEVEHYEPWVVARDNFDFALKASNGPNNTSSLQLTNSPQHPTIQFINGGNGGERSYKHYHYKHFFGTSATASGNTFGYLEAFQHNPTKDAPALHQFGAKLLWFDESQTEAYLPPLRSGVWSQPSHTAYNPATIAHWNVRPQLSTRSPASPCTSDWYPTSSGAWMTQLAPFSPANPLDLPTQNAVGQYVKFPFGAATSLPNTHAAVLFELPNTQHPTLSIAQLRHAQLSPYSWHPSYLIGSSLIDQHAPFGASAHQHTSLTATNTSLWDALNGGAAAKHSSHHGPRTESPTSDGLLETGHLATHVDINGSSIDTSNEILAYDIAFETNLNLWDSFFFSGLQLTPSGITHIQKPLEQSQLANQRFCFNSDSRHSIPDLEQLLKSDKGLATAFWSAGEFLKNKAAFNVNSTSEIAWAALLSGTRQSQSQPNSTASDLAHSIFTRTHKASVVVNTPFLSPNSPSAWSGARTLTDQEIALLAKAIVVEVKKRGPFISLADMVNRRLIPPEKSLTNPAALCGTIESAIRNTKLNQAFNHGYWLSTADTSNDNNKSEFQIDHRLRSPKSKAWGAPSYLTQADIIEPLAPAMTVRGDTFTIRSYGESREGNTIKATAYLEATVTRTPHYLQHSPATSSRLGNAPTDAAMLLNYADGSVTQGLLTPINQRYGRRFKIQSLRWLSAAEI